MKKIAILVLLIVFSINMLYVQASWMKNTKEYKLVNNKQLDKTVNDIFYNLPDETGLREPGFILKNSVNGKTKILNDIIIDYNSNKIIKSGFSPSWFYVSDNLEYFGRERRIKRSTKDQSGENVFELYKKNGSKLFEMKVETSYEYKVWDFKILNNGYVLMIDHMGGIIKSINQAGILIKEKDFLIGVGFDRSRGFTIKDTKDSKFLALNATDRDTINFTNYATAYLIDLDLNVIFIKRSLYHRMSVINVSNSGKAMAFACADRSGSENKYRSYIINITDNKSYEYNDYYISQSTFYNDFVMLFNPRLGLKLFDVINGGEIFNYRHRILPFAYDYAPDAKLVFALEGKYGRSTGEESNKPLKNVRLKILKLDGKPVFSLDLGTIDYKSRGRCFVSCTNDASKFILKVGDNIYTYEEVK